MANLASGSSVSLRFCREGTTRNKVPAAVGAPLSYTSIAPGTGDAVITVSGGGFTAGEYAAGQYLKLSGSTPGANDGLYRINSVDSDTVVTVEDAGGVLVDGTGTLELAFIELLANGRSLNLEKDELESARVNADGQQSDSRHGFNRVVGNPSFELSLQDFDPALELALAGLWTPVTIGTVTTLTATISPDNLARAAGSWIDDGIRQGDVIRLTGDNAGDWVVTQVVDGSNIRVSSDSGATWAAGSPSAISYPGARLDMGTGVETAVFERAFPDINQYQVFKGVAGNGIQASVSPTEIVSMTWDLLGMSQDAWSGSALDESAVYVTPKNSPFAAFDGALYEDGTKIAVVTGMEFTINRNRQTQPVVGSKFSPDVFEATSNITGTASMFFENATLLNKFVDETETQLTVTFRDPGNANNFMAWTLPRVKYNGGTIDPPTEGPVVIEVPFRALLNSNLNGGVNTSFSIQRSNAN